MKFLFSILLALCISGTIFAQTQKKCFINSGLKDEDRVYLTLTGVQVAGEFVTNRDYDTARREIWAFSGTKAGNDLSIKFAGGKTPDALPRNLETFVWTLATVHGKEALRIKFYGKNYTTNKSAVYTAEFESCQPT